MSIIPQDYYFKKMLKSKTYIEYLKNSDAFLQQQVINSSLLIEYYINRWIITCSNLFFGKIN